MNIKRSMVVGATVATIAAGVSGVGLVSAATDTSTTSSSSSSTGTSLVDKLVAKFKLNKSEVQAVFDADRKEHDAEREADQKAKLATAVTDGKITQAQSDYITNALSEIKALRGTSDPKSESDTVREQMKTKMDALRTWAADNNVDMQYVMMGGPGGHGFGGPGGPRGEAGTSTSSTSTSSTN